MSLVRSHSAGQNFLMVIVRFLETFVGSMSADCRTWSAASLFFFIIIDFEARWLLLLLCTEGHGQTIFTATTPIVVLTVLLIGGSTGTMLEALEVVTGFTSRKGIQDKTKRVP
ncbi:unnamed protein product [Cochlearia groenlandica]